MDLYESSSQHYSETKYFQIRHTETWLPRITQRDYPVLSFINNFNDTGNQETQKKQGAIWYIEQDSLLWKLITYAPYLEACLL